MVGTSNLGPLIWQKYRWSRFSCIDNHSLGFCKHLTINKRDLIWFRLQLEAVNDRLCIYDYGVSENGVHPNLWSFNGENSVPVDGMSYSPILDKPTWKPTMKTGVDPNIRAIFIVWQIISSHDRKVGPGPKEPDRQGPRAYACMRCWHRRISVWGMDWRRQKKLFVQFTWNWDTMPKQLQGPPVVSPASRHWSTSSTRHCRPVKSKDKNFPSHRWWLAVRQNRVLDGGQAASALAASRGNLCPNPASNGRSSRTTRTTRPKRSDHWRIAWYF